MASACFRCCEMSSITCWVCWQRLLQYGYKFQNSSCLFHNPHDSRTFPGWPVSRRQVSHHAFPRLSKDAISFTHVCAPRLLDRTRLDLLGWLIDRVCDLVRAKRGSGCPLVLCRLEISVSLVTVPSSSWNVTLLSLFGGGPGAGDGEAVASMARCCRSA